MKTKEQLIDETLNEAFMEIHKINTRQRTDDFYINPYGLEKWFRLMYKVIELEAMDHRLIEGDDYDEGT